MSFPISAPPSEPQIRGHFYWALKGTLSLGFNTFFALLTFDPPIFAGPAFRSGPVKVFRQRRAAPLPTPLRPCLSATPRSGCSALAALASRHRQRPDPPQHLAEQLPVQMPFGQEQPVVVGMLDEPTAGLHQPMLQTR